MKQEENINEIYQNNFTGLGLKGTIAEVRKEQVRIALDIDGGIETEQYFYNWYPKTGNSLYAIPDSKYYKNRHLDTREGNMLQLNEEGIDILNRGSGTVCLNNCSISIDSGEKLYISAGEKIKMLAKRIIVDTPDEVNICQE